MTQPVVLVVDDDDTVRRFVARLLRGAGYQVQTFASAREFLETGIPEQPCCVVLDVKMPGRSGLELLDEMRSAGIATPVVFLTGFGTVPMSVRAMKAGAVDFIEKPFEKDRLLESVEQALERARRDWDDQLRVTTLRRRLDMLTPREREVMVLVVAGMSNKQIAGELGTSDNTIKIHRGRVMQKMEAESLAELVRMGQQLGLGPNPPDA